MRDHSALPHRTIDLHPRGRGPSIPSAATAAVPPWIHQSEAPLEAALRGLGQEHIGPAATVWATGQDSDAAQRAGRYLPQTTSHPQRTHPALAAQAIARYSHTGNTVFDPFAGAGTTVVEAMYAGRRGIGVDLDPRWTELTGLNLHHAHRHGATGAGMILRSDARYLPPPPLRLRGSVDLIVTSPPARLRPPGHPASRALSNTDLVEQFEADLKLSFTSWVPLVRPGTTIVLTTRLLHRAQQTLDLTLPIAHATQWAGLDYLERVAALRIPLRDAQPRPRGPLQGRHRGRARPGRPRVIHDDVLVYRVPAAQPTRGRGR
jgi:modification methylase